MPRLEADGFRTGNINASTSNMYSNCIDFDDDKHYILAKTKNKLDLNEKNGICESFLSMINNMFTDDNF